MEYTQIIQKLIVKKSEYWKVKTIKTIWTDQQCKHACASFSVSIFRNRSVHCCRRAVSVQQRMNEVSRLLVWQSRTLKSTTPDALAAGRS